MKCKILGILFITFSYAYVLSDKQIGMSPWHFTENWSNIIKNWVLTFLFFMPSRHILLFEGVLRFFAFSHLNLIKPIGFPEVSSIFFFKEFTMKGVSSSTWSLACATALTFFSTKISSSSYSDLVNRFIIFLIFAGFVLLN